jgi:hypothetical protein
MRDCSARSLSHGVDVGICWNDGFGLQLLFRVSQVGMDFSRRGIANLYLVFQLSAVLAAGGRIVFSFETKYTQATVVTGIP